MTTSAFVFGCAETAKLRGGVAATEKKIEQIEKNGAYVCAPKELALAKAHIEFAKLEISQGRQSRAKEHFELAVQNAELADEKSPPDKCAGPAVIVEEWPEDPDTDGDGVPDSKDQCPLDPEDKDDYLDDDGCPDSDNDLDGVPDSADQCMNDPEDPDGFEDEDGCPDSDNDKDTVLDVSDECPNVQGEVENNGCPKKYEGVEITSTHIRINQKIYFAFNKATIKKKSYWILNQVVTVLKDYPDITLSIEGHTDSVGGNDYNKTLSTKRAAAVRDYLVQKGGIGSERLVSVGFGEERPIDTNSTKDGRAANRRVEFVRTDVQQKSE